MFVPEYSITNNTLNSIAACEYAKAVIENTTILSNFQKRQQKEAKLEFISNTLKFYGMAADYEAIKRKVEGLDNRPNPYVLGLLDALNLVQEMSASAELDDDSIKKILCALIRDPKAGSYRERKIEGKVLPEEILANIGELIDWHNSLDAKETHPLIVAGIMKAQLDIIFPFEEFNHTVTSLVALFVLQANGYKLNEYSLPQNFYIKSKKVCETTLFLTREEEDFTTWLEYFTEGIASELSNLEQKVKLMVKDSKIARTTTKTDLTERQERIIEYLQDYGPIQNKHFSVIFPDKSEDSILRDLKKLIDDGIIAKRGSTKSSRYELV